MMTRRWLGMALLVLAASACTPAAARPNMTIAVQPTATPEQLSTSASELQAYLEDRLDREVELVFPTT